MGFQGGRYREADGFLCSGGIGYLINLEKLEACVLAAIRTQIALLLEAESILSQIDRIPENQTGVKVVDNQIKDSEAQIARYKNLKVQRSPSVRSG